MTPEQILRAIEHYELTVLAPTRNRVPPGSAWYARSNDGERHGFGATPAAAVEAAVAPTPSPAKVVEVDLDFLN